MRMDADEWQERYGLRPAKSLLSEVRRVLGEHAALEYYRQGAGDTELMRLCCVQLFGAGDVADALNIWCAKRASMDAGSAIEVQLLCGAGLEETKSYLATSKDPQAQPALNYLEQCVEAGDFEGFDPATWFADCEEFYR